VSVTEGGTGPADDRPLTQQEYQQVQRLFSDPISIPIQFKTWLVSFLESSDLNLPFSAVNGLIDMLGITGVGGGSLGILPAGLILPYGGDTAPTGSKLCDGGAYTTTVETRLFTAIGYKFGGSGTSFNVPDMQGRAPVGRGSNADVNAIGKNEGQPLANRSPLHGHGQTLVGNRSGNVSSGQPTGYIALTDYAPDGTVNPPTGTNRPVDSPAFEVVNFIIVA